MNIEINDKNWNSIKAYCEMTLKSNPVSYISTIGTDSVPHIAPFGSVVLTDDKSGFFSTKFTSTFDDNLTHNNNVSILFDTDKFPSLVDHPVVPFEKS